MKLVKVILLLMFGVVVNTQLSAQTTTYLWSNGATTPSISVNPSVTTTYRVTITHGGVQYFDSLVVNVNASNAPTFTQVGPYVSGASIPALPTTSNNGITGTWSPAINNTATTTYTFTPTTGQCATTTTMIITINQPLKYTLTANDSTVCAGTTVTLSVNLQQSNTVTDIDGNTYPTVQIGTQLWMQENLRTTKYSDGSNIPLVMDNAQWSSNSNNGTTFPMMCWYNNDQATYTANKFGALYNWDAVNPTTNGNKNVCPTGWHVPSDAEWTVLSNYLGGRSVAGGKMKTTGMQYWESPNTGATNESGFSGLPGGYRTSDSGAFYLVGRAAHWWSSSEFDTIDVLGHYLNNLYGNVVRGWSSRVRGYSVRCIKD